MANSANTSESASVVAVTSTCIVDTTTTTTINNNRYSYNRNLHLCRTRRYCHQTIRRLIVGMAIISTILLTLQNRFLFTHSKAKVVSISLVSAWTIASSSHSTSRTSRTETKRLVSKTTVVPKTTTLLMSSDKNMNWMENIASNFIKMNPLSTTNGSGTDNTNDYEGALGVQQSSIDTWDSIRQKWSDACTTDDERNFRSLVQQGRIASPLINTVRLFGNDRIEDVRVTFYRDSASWCPYCQKIWISLEEKQISYKVEKINMSCYGKKPAMFLVLQPSGQIPVATIDGQIYRQSNDILQVLDDKFPNSIPQLNVGNDPNYDSNRYYTLLKLERSLFSAWMGWLTGGYGKDGFIQTLDYVEEQLGQTDGPFFMGGTSLSMIDIQFVPFLERMVASLLYYKGFQIRYSPSDANKQYPNINKWFDGMESLSSYRLTKSDYYSHCWDLPPQLGGCVMENNGKVYSEQIDNFYSDSSSTDMTTNRIEPYWDWISVRQAQRDVIERISYNHKALIQFAARGCGTKGVPRVAAQLADPNAKPTSNPLILDSISISLRYICLLLLELESDTKQGENETNILVLKNELLTGIVQNNIQDDVVQCLAYIRDRVGVPRDMSFPAAQIFRTQLNKLMEQIIITTTKTKSTTTIAKSTASS